MRWVLPTHTGVPHGWSKEQGWGRQVLGLSLLGARWCGWGRGMGCQPGMGAHRSQQCHPRLGWGQTGCQPWARQGAVTSPGTSPCSGTSGWGLGHLQVSLWLFLILVLLFHTPLPSLTGKEKTAAMVVVGFPSKGCRRRVLAAQAPELLA